MKLDEKSVIPIPHEDNDAVQERQRRRNPSETSHNDHLQYLPSLARSFQNDELSTPLSQSPYSRSKSTSNRKKPNSHYVEMNLSDRSSRYTPNLSHSAPELRSQHDGPYPNRKSPVSLDGMPLNEKEKKWWDELRETAGNLADFASFVHRTGKVPPRNDLEWARSNFHIFSESMSALQMVTGVLHGEGPRFPDAGLSKLNMSNSNTYGKRLLSQSPILENRNNHPLSTAFHPPQLNRKISYDQNIFPGRGFRSSSSLAESRSYNGVASMMPDQRSLSRQEYGPERMDVEQTRWRDDLVDTNDRTRDRIRHEIPQEQKSYYPDSLEPNRNIIGERSYPFRPQTSPHNSFSHYSNDASRSTYYNSNDQQRPIIEADHHIHQMPLIGRNSIQNSAGLPIPQSPSHDPRSFHIKRRASSDYGGHPHSTNYSTNYSPPFRGSSRDQHFPQHDSHFPSGYYRDEYMDSNQIDHSYMSGDDGGSSVGGGGGGGGGGDIGLGFRPSKYRKRSRAPAPGSCVSCGVRDTPEWRRGPNGARTLCNACGLHFSKLLRKKKQEQSDDSASVSIEELRSSLKLPGSGSVGQTSPPF